MGEEVECASRCNDGCCCCSSSSSWAGTAPALLLLLSVPPFGAGRRGVDDVESLDLFSCMVPVPRRVTNQQSGFRWLRLFLLARVSSRKLRQIWTGARNIPHTLVKKTSTSLLEGSSFFLVPLTGRGGASPRTVSVHSWSTQKLTCQMYSLQIVMHNYLHY